jgi:hypothetical protein
MSSFIKQFKKRNSPLKVTGLNTPSFEIAGGVSNGDQYPFPFTFNRRTAELDLDADVYDFQTRWLDNGESPVKTEFNIEPLGGSHIVQSIGTKLKEYLVAWFDEDRDYDSIDSIDSIILHKKPVVTRVRVLSNQFCHTDEVSITTTEPSFSDVTHPNDGHVYVFKTPMVIRVTSDGSFKYISFSSVFDKA